MGIRLPQIAGIGGLLLGGTTIYGGYKIYDNKNPTGSRLLSKDNYTFKPPKFTNYKNLNHGCSENLFKEDSGFESEKLYGCGVAEMDIYEAKNQFTEQTKTVDYIAFNSEIAIRKGDKGWKINTMVDNYNLEAFGYHHLLTTYKKGNDGWKETDSAFIVPVVDSKSVTVLKIEDRANQNHKDEWVTLNSKLRIKVLDNVWYDKADYELLYAGNPDIRNGIKKRHKEKKSWSGIWMHSNSGSDDSWIFKDIEVFMKDKKYSQIFCKESSSASSECRQDEEKSTKTRIFNKPSFYGEEPQHSEDNWDDSGRLHSEEHVGVKVQDKVNPLITEIKDSRGKWVNSKDICDAGYARNIKEEQKQQLKMFCSIKN